MLWRQILIVGSLMVAAVIIEVTLLARLGLPGATPDLVVVTVVAIALAMGPTQGAVAGFTGGLLLGLAPPAAGTLGVTAIIYLAIGFITGMVIDPRDRTVPLLIGLVGLSAGAATLATAAVNTMLGSGRVSWDAVPGLVLSSALYAIVLAPVVVLGVAWLVRKATPEVLVA